MPNANQRGFNIANFKGYLSSAGVLKNHDYVAIFPMHFLNGTGRKYGGFFGTFDREPAGHVVPFCKPDVSNASAAGSAGIFQKTDSHLCAARQYRQRQTSYRTP